MRSRAQHHEIAAPVLTLGQAGDSAGHTRACGFIEADFAINLLKGKEG
jgi:hypothetical protein